ncbi:hypothetical protein STEG23_036528 [Scotinomys teguina]
MELENVILSEAEIMQKNQFDYSSAAKREVAFGNGGAKAKEQEPIPERITEYYSKSTSNILMSKSIY